MDVAHLRAMAVGDAADTQFVGAVVPVDYNPDSDQFIVRVRPLETERIRLVVGVRHNRSDDTWRMPALRAQAYGLSGVFGGRLDPTPAANAKVAELVKDANDGEAIKAGRVPYVSPELDGLYSYQRVGVAFLLHAGSALLADDMGLGKSIMAIHWMREVDPSGAHMVICTNSMKFKFRDELEKWWPAAITIVVDGTASQRRKQIQQAEELAPGDEPVVVVINYESLRAHTRLAPWGGRALTDKQKERGEFNTFQWSTIVVDEAQKIANPGSQQTMAVKQMGLQAGERLAMTGTPILNSIDDWWSIMNFVCPDLVGSRNQFRNRYCIMTNAWHGGFENLGLKPDTRSEFDSFALPIYIRRTKVEALPELPEKLAVDYRVLPLSSKQKKTYKAIAKDLMAHIDGEMLLASNPLARDTILGQVACAVPVVDEDGKVIALEGPSNKLDAILDILDEAPGDPLVVYAESRKFIEFLGFQLEKKGYTVGYVTGAQNARQRATSIDKFQDGKLDLILGTLGAGAEGITLTRANRIVLAQLSWSHATNIQAIDRIHRIGQTRGVHPIVLLSEGTIDLTRFLVDKDKEGRLQDLFRDPEWVKAAMIGEAWVPKDK